MKGFNFMGRLGRLGVRTLSPIGLASLLRKLRLTHAPRRPADTRWRRTRVERERLDLEVRQRTTELTDLTRHLLAAREDERHRLARELHDELGALLTSAKLDAARIRSRLGDAAPEAQERLAHLVQTLDAGIALGRRIGEDLRPSTLTHLGLKAAVDGLARDFADQSGLNVHIDTEAVHLSRSAELVVYRVVQEAVTNLSKHAGARQVWIALREHDGQVHALIRDDGSGFEPDAPRRSAFGLLGMRCRAEAEHGQLTVESAPARGTSIRLVLPVSA